MAIAGGAAVLAIKMVAFLVTDSVALLSDALESVLNIVASVMMFVSLSISDKPADEDHKYGHRKAEGLSCFVEGLLILFAAVLILEASIGRLFDPMPFTNLDIGLAISLSATALNGILSYQLLKVARRTNSLALEGDAKHPFTDVLSSVGVVLALLVASATGLTVLDPLVALVVAALIVRMGLGLLRKACRDLMDQSCPDTEERIRSVLDRCDGFIEYHDLKTRRSGGVVFTEFHLCVDGGISVHRAHDLTDKIERELEKEVPGIDVTVHVETEDQAHSEQ